MPVGDCGVSNCGLRIADRGLIACPSSFVLRPSCFVLRPWSVRIDCLQQNQHVERHPLQRYKVHVAEHVGEVIGREGKHYAADEGGRPIACQVVAKQISAIAREHEAAEKYQVVCCYQVEAEKL